MLRGTLSLLLMLCAVAVAKAQNGPPRPDLETIKRRTAPARQIFGLYHKLRSGNFTERMESAQGLADYAAMLQSVVQVLSTELRTEGDAKLRLEIAQALANVGPSARYAVPDLINALKDEDENVRRMAAIALGNIGLYARAAVPALTAALKDKAKRVRRRAATALGMIGPDARTAVPALIPLLDDPDVAHGMNEVSVRQCAIYALEEIGPAAEAAVPALLKLWKESKDDRVRSRCLVGVSRIRPDRKCAIPLLIKGLKDPQTRGDAAWALACIKPPPKEAVPALLEALRAKPVSYAVEARRIKTGIMEALCVIGTQAKEVLPALRELTKDSDEQIRLFARKALQKIEKRE